MPLISRFDPWQSSLCTCPSKLTFNPYTGCDHACVYCYATSYIPRFFRCRPKSELIPRLRREARKLKGEIVSISNSSDPYPTAEAEKGLMRNCLEALSQSDCKIQIITKSAIVVRDIDVLKRIPSMVSVTITTGDNELAKLIEPNAPPPSQRLKAVETLIEKGVPTSVRIDPIIPFANDDAESLIETLASMGVKHITGSTYKVKPDNWQRLSIALPKVAERLKPLYFENGERISRYVYLPKQLRFELMKNMGTAAEKFGIKFATCRENLSHLNTATCDGSWLIKGKTP
jgi:DNA repair photolyase